MAGLMIFASVFILASLVHLSVATEEMCSKFWYEKEIITNMLKMELKVEKMEQEVMKRNEDIVTMFDDKIAEVEDALKIISGKVDDVLEEAAERGLAKPTIAFSTYVKTSKLHIPQNQIIVFSSILSNVGNGYNSASGKFVAPVAGYYLLSCSLLSRSGEEFWASIEVNNSKKAHLYERGADSRYGMASQTIVVELKANDVVSVKTQNNAINIYGNGYSTFNGVLIR
ncbi:complement C1q tumor necrosis factor-related protein 6-like [Ruditapes philippinarum]|uniref:complement C1q tumor necrosis factor-related protein 6-like n=1 Tax=Ruditapes philippinarum TaxID=129788 RepID=UPI00295C1C0C|nr:complement C1q tumor necrosis factor-related protein 6-like [Ruditapes philippinarum]